MGNNVSDLKDAAGTNNIDPLLIGSHSIVDFDEPFSQKSNLRQPLTNKYSNMNKVNNPNLDISMRNGFKDTPTTEYIEHIDPYSSSDSSYMSDCSSCKNYYHNQHVETIEFEKKNHDHIKNYIHGRSASPSSSPKHRHKHHRQNVVVHESNDVFSERSTDDDTMQDTPERDDSGLELRRFSNVHPGYEQIVRSINVDSDNNILIDEMLTQPPKLETKHTSEQNVPNSINTSGYSSRNVSVSFFSETNQDAAQYDHATNEFKNRQLNQQNHQQQQESPEVQSYKSGFINEFTSPVPGEQEVYTTDIPIFYLPERIRYPYRSPYEYTDSEFDLLNHFDFLKSLNFKEPPLLPPYLGSNLLNDSSSHNYKTYPYQYQQSNDLYVNDQYHYNINDLHIMDKYSQPPKRKSSIRSPKMNQTADYSILENSNVVTNDETDMEIDNPNTNGDIPNHVMLNHLITCNLKNDMNAVMTGSCIHRYGGKFITQIMYFSTDTGPST